MPTAPMWTGARLAAVGIAEELDAVNDATIWSGQRGDTIGAALFPVHRKRQTEQRAAEAIGFDPVFLVWDFCQKNQAKSKSNFVGRCPGAASNCPRFSIR
jgi:hypothetical protein